MKLEIPPVARKLFTRLCKGDNLLLSLNGPNDDHDLYRQVEADEDPCREFFAVLGFRLQKGENCYYFTLDDEPNAVIETKLDKIIKLVRWLEFFHVNVDNFGEGVHFAAATLESKCNANSEAEKVLRETAPKGNSNAERLDSILQSLVRQGYLSEYDPGRKEYRVLSAINYLQEMADRIQIHESQIEEGGTDNAGA